VVVICVDGLGVAVAEIGVGIAEAACGRYSLSASVIWSIGISAIVANDRADWRGRH